MLAEASAPLLAALYLEVTPPVLALMIAAFLLHEATALWDVSYAVKLREVSPVEQHVHGFLQTMPLIAIALVSALHWPELQELLGLRPRRSDRWWRLSGARCPAITGPRISRPIWRSKSRPISRSCGALGGRARTGDRSEATARSSAGRVRLSVLFRARRQGVHRGERHAFPEPGSNPIKGLLRHSPAADRRKRRRTAARFDPWPQAAPMEPEARPTTPSL